MPIVKHPGSMASHLATAYSTPGQAPRVAQATGGEWPGIQQDRGKIDVNHYQSGPGFNAGVDPAGVAIQNRGMANRAAYDQAEYARDPFGSSMGPLPDPRWEGLKQAMAESGVSRVRGGASPEGSKQLTGMSVQPGQGSLTTYGNAAGVTQGGMMKAAQPGAGDPSWLRTAGPSTQDMYRRRQQQALGGLQGAM